MKNIKATQITLRNFKGAKDLTVKFGNITQIKGDNKTGKTTVVDARCWLWTGKDSKGDTDFDIKPLDEFNKPIHKLETEVEEILDDGTKLRKVYKEVWRTKRGESEEYLAGHTTDYWINDVPKSKTEYETKVSTIIDSGIARLVSDPKYFNEILKWEERRVILSDMAKTPTVEEIVQNTTENLQDVVNLINEGKVLEEERKRVKAEITICKKGKDGNGGLKAIDPAIKENIRMKPEPLDYDSIEKDINGLEIQLIGINESINDVSKSYQTQADANAQLIKSKAEKQTKYSQLDSALRSAPNKELDAYYTELNQKKEELAQLNTEHTDEVIERNKIFNKLESSKQDREKLLGEYRTITASEFKISECSFCGSELETKGKDKSELVSNFNAQKAEKLKSNQEKGLAKKEEIEKLEKDLETFEKSVEQMKVDLSAKQEEIDALVKPTTEHTPTPEMIALQSEIDSIVIPEIVRADTSELNEKKKAIQEQLDELKNQLGTREQAKKIDDRIEELTQQKRVLSQQIAELEKLEFQIETYQNSEMDLIEKRVNDKFAIVKFKMFEKQMNGGIKQTCVAMVDGVPYKSVNTAGQIQASLDIINAMQHHYQTFAPVFIDNAESITEIPTMQCQTVQLIVDKNFKKLEVFTLD